MRSPRSDDRIIHFYQFKFFFYFNWGGGKIMMLDLRMKDLFYVSRLLFLKKIRVFEVEGISIHVPLLHR